MIKAIFFDIDGTLVSFRTHRISPAVLDGLRRLQAKGVKLFIATGRQLEAARAAAGVFPFDGWITVSGQYCLAGTGSCAATPSRRSGAPGLLTCWSGQRPPASFWRAKRATPSTRTPGWSSSPPS